MNYKEIYLKNKTTINIAVVSVLFVGLFIYFKTQGKKARERFDKENEDNKNKAIAAEKLVQEQLAKEKAELEKNNTHEYSVSNGIHYCKYCGGDEKWREFDCKRELGHKYTLRRVQNKIGFDYSFQPICNNCGDIRHYCQPDNKYEFKCKVK